MGRIVYKGDNYNLYPIKYNVNGLVPQRRMIHALMPKNTKRRKVSGIYKLSFNDYFYIGRSCDIRSRIKNHIQALDRLISKQTTKVYQKNIFDFIINNPDFSLCEVTVLQECDESIFQQAEQKWIDKYKTDKKLLNGRLKAGRTVRDKIWEQFQAGVYQMNVQIEKFEDYLVYKKLMANGKLFNIQDLIRDSYLNQ